MLAESEDTIVVEGNHYFPSGSVNREYFRDSDSTTVCPWKGKASYYDVVVDEDVNSAAAWYYPEPSEAADNIRDMVAFGGGVKVS